MKNSNLIYFFKIAKKNFLILLSSSLFGLFLGYLIYNSGYEEHEYKFSLYPILDTENVFRTFTGSEALLYDYVRILKEDITNKDLSLSENKLNKYKDIKNNLQFLKERIDYEINVFHVSFKKSYKKNQKNKTKLIQNDINEIYELLLLTNNILQLKLLNTITNNPRYFIFGGDNNPYVDFLSFLKRQMSHRSNEFNKNIVNGKDSIVVQNQLKEISIMKACVDIFTQDFENHLSSKYIKNIEVLLSDNNLHLVKGIHSKKNLIHNVVGKNIKIYLFFSALSLLIISFSIILIIELRRKKKL